jgi:hypothetical protein
MFYPRNPPKLPYIATPADKGARTMLRCKNACSLFVARFIEQRTHSQSTRTTNKIGCYWVKPSPGVWLATLAGQLGLPISKLLVDNVDRVPGE